MTEAIGAAEQVIINTILRNAQEEKEAIDPERQGNIITALDTTLAFFDPKKHENNLIFPGSFGGKLEEVLEQVTGGLRHSRGGHTDIETMMRATGDSKEWEVSDVMEVADLPNYKLVELKQRKGEKHLMWVRF